MKIEAFDKWKIEVTEDYVKINGQIVTPQAQVLSDMMSKDEELGLYDQPTDCDGTPLEYGDEMVCVKEFTDIDGVTWRELEESPYRKIQKINPKYSEFTHSELKNFRKLL